MRCNFSRQPGWNGENYRAKNIGPNKAMQTLKGEPMWKSVKGFQIRASSNKVQITREARETRLLQCKDKNETVLLMLFCE